MEAMKKAATNNKIGSNQSFARQSWYLSSYKLFDDENFVTFYIYDLNIDRSLITVAISNQGRLSTQTFDLLEDEYGFYFEYGYWFPQPIRVADFE